jgi:hypothetical protein
VADGDAAQPRRPTHLSVGNVAADLGNQLLTRSRQAQDREQVSLRPACHQQRGFLLEDAGGFGLQGVDGRVFGEHVVAERRLDHRVEHRLGWLRDGVASKIQSQRSFDRGVGAQGLDGDGHALIIVWGRSLPGEWMGLIRWTLPVLGIAATTVLVSNIFRPAEPVPGSPPRLTAHAGVVPRQQADLLTRQGGVVIQVDARAGEVVPTQRVLVHVNGPEGLEVLIAPFPGTVTAVLVRAGEALGPGTVVATVADLTRLQVETIDVDAYLVSLIHVGQRARLEVDGRTLLGRVSRIGLLPERGPAGDEHYPVLIEPPDQARDLLAGTPVQVTFLD